MNFEMQRITQIVPHYAGMIGRNLGAVAAPRTTAAACALTSTSAAAAAAKAVVWLRRLVRVRAILFTPAQAIFPPSLSQAVENIRVTRNVTMQPNGRPLYCMQIGRRNRSVLACCTLHSRRHERYPICFPLDITWKVMVYRAGHGISNTSCSDTIYVV